VTAEVSTGERATLGSAGVLGRAGVLTPEAVLPTRLVRSLAPRGAATVRPAQAKVAMRDSERKYIVGVE
jgi:hypothetical protein